MLGAISPDPDGAGALRRRAAKTTYNSDGQPSVSEVGTVDGTSDGDWSAFVSLQQSTATYDANGRETKAVATAGGNTYGVMQYSYDAVGRVECTALRMNPAAWGALPASACTLGTTGTFGPDRISRTTFDAAGQATKVQSAYGTADQSDEASATYNANGTTETLTDANGNLTSDGSTSYTYDVENRLVSASGAHTLSLAYDPLGRLWQTSGGSLGTSQFVYDGQEMVAEYDGANTLRRRFAFGAGTDEPVLWDEGSSMDCSSVPRERKRSSSGLLNHSDETRPIRSPRLMSTL